MDEFIFSILKNFAEENWEDFIQRCKENGLTEEEVEKEFDSGE